MRRLKLIPTIIVKYILVTFYRLFCLACKVDESKITFASYRSNELKDNLAFVSREFDESYPAYKKVYLFKKLDSTVFGKVTYIFHMIHACYHMATSRYFLIDDFYFPVYVIKPRDGMEIIQLWHSAGALKKFGLSTVGKPYGPSREYLKHVNIHGNYSKVFVSSSEVIPFFAEAFNLSESRIFPLGVPRTDYFFEKETVVELKERFIIEFPEMIGKKVILYAPTFRGKSHYQDKFELPFDVKVMEESLGREYALLIHLHPYMQAGVTVDGGFARMIHNGFTIEELMMMTDLLITDYSTVFFDYSLLGRPMIFYPYDLEDYVKNRDFYYRYREMVPGPIATTTDSLVEVIKKAEFDLKKVSEFRNRFFDIQDGRATERIVENILGIDERKRNAL